MRERRRVRQPRARTGTMHCMASASRAAPAHFEAHPPPRRYYRRSKGRKARLTGALSRAPTGGASFGSLLKAIGNRHSISRMSSTHTHRPQLVLGHDSGHSGLGPKADTLLCERTEGTEPRPCSSRTRHTPNRTLGLPQFYVPSMAGARRPPKLATTATWHPQDSRPRNQVVISTTTQVRRSIPGTADSPLPVTLPRPLPAQPAPPPSTWRCAAEKRPYERLSARSPADEGPVLCYDAAGKVTVICRAFFENLAFTFVGITCQAGHCGVDASPGDDNPSTYPQAPNMASIANATEWLSYP